jgi:hypothetical protein
MLRSVPGGTSSPGLPATVTVPALVGWTHSLDQYAVDQYAVDEFWGEPAAVSSPA